MQILVVQNTKMSKNTVDGSRTMNTFGTSEKNGDKIIDCGNSLDYFGPNKLRMVSVLTVVLGP